MKLEDQVCNLELSKRLKELGVKQESYFFWAGWQSRPSLYTSSTFRSSQLGDSFSAFTVAELGEMLPDGYFKTWKRNSHFEILYTKNNEPRLDFEWCLANTEADARAKMLIYLLENKLIESPASEEAK